MTIEEKIATKDGKCSKCGRVIKKGWKWYWDSEQRLAYCKPCSVTLKEGEQVVSKDDDSNLLLNELAGEVRLFNDMLVKVGEQLSALNVTASDTSNRITDLQLRFQELSKLVTAKSSKK